MNWSTYAAAIGIVLIAACGSDNTKNDKPIVINNGVGDTGADNVADAGNNNGVDQGHTSDATTTNSGSDMGTTGPYVPPMTTVCTAPTVGTPTTLTPAGSAMSLRAVYNGSEVGLGFIASPDSTNWTAYLQRVSPDGMQSGDPVLLGTSDASQYNQPLGLASDGTGWVACFATADGAQCKSLTSQAAVLPQGSTNPAVVYGVGGYVVFWVQSGSVMAQRLDSSGQLAGDPSTVGTAPSTVYSLDAVASTTGFGVVVGGGGPGTFYLVDGNLAAVGAPSTVGNAREAMGIAVSGDTYGLAWIDSQGEAEAAVIGAQGPTTPVTFSMGAQSYGKMAIGGGDGGFAVVWDAFDGTMNVRSMSTAGEISGDKVTADSVNWDENAVSIVAVGDHMLLFTTLTSSANSIDVVPLNCN